MRRINEMAQRSLRNLTVFGKRVLKLAAFLIALRIVVLPAALRQFMQTVSHDGCGKILKWTQLLWHDSQVVLKAIKAINYSSALGTPVRMRNIFMLFLKLY